MTTVEGDPKKFKTHYVSVFGGNDDELESMLNNLADDGYIIITIIPVSISTLSWEASKYKIVYKTADV